MTAFSTVFDSLISRIATLLPDHKRLPDAYEVSANDDLYLVQGWSLGIGPGTNPQRWLTTHKSINLDLELKLTRKAYALDHDPTKKQLAEKNLFTDLEILYDDAHNNNMTLSGPVVRILSIGPIESVDTDRENYRVLTATINVEYFRT